ncbi:MAG: BON domain-containing protein [Armatimonadota bacterium]|nr:MAG: BON domain-containing protein [Armatimonadota bacterium]
MPEHGHAEHEVRKALHENEDTAGLDLKIKFVNGVVFLDGTAPTAALKDTAAEIAGKIEGVTLVRNRLQVKPEAHTTRELFREGEKK